MRKVGLLWKNPFRQYSFIIRESFNTFACERLSFCNNSPPHVQIQQVVSSYVINDRAKPSPRPESLFFCRTRFVRIRQLLCEIIEEKGKKVVSTIKIPLIVLLLQGIPESVAVATLAFVIARIPLKWNKVLLIGIVLAFCAYVIRLFPIPFGIHTILLILLLFIFLTGLGKRDIGLSFFASLVTILVLGILEYNCMSLFMLFFGFTPETLFNNLVIRIVVGEPHVLLLFISAFLLKKYSKREAVGNFN